MNNEELLQQGLTFHQQGQLSEAKKIYEQILKSDPKHFHTLQLTASLYWQQQKNTEALHYFDAALTINPNFAPLHNNRGNALQDLKRFDEALKSYDLAIEQKPDYAEAYYNRGTAFYELERYEEALQSYDLAIEKKPDYAEAYYNRGISFHNLKRFNEEIKSYNRVIELIPNYAEAYNNRGNALKELKRYDEALQDYDKAIQLIPNYAEAYNNRGDAIQELKRFDEALQDYDKAIQLKPDFYEAYSNRGTLFYDLQRFKESLNNYNKAIELKPDVAEGFSNRGNTLKELKRFDEALKDYDKAIQLKPDYQEANWNKSLIKLRLGEYEEGWQLYEYRKDNKKTKINYPKFPVPLWLGDASIEGKTLLVHSEQGLGDTLHFCRYLTMLQSLKPKEIIFYVQKSLISILSSIDNEITFIEKNHPLPSFDYYCPLMSLPLAFKTTLKTIPANIPYLKVNDVKNTYWQDQLGKQTKPRIGLVWSGSTKHTNDHNRSLMLTQLFSVLALPFEFHSLQKDIRDGDKQTLKAYKNLDQHHKDLDDFSDTAALVNQMDLIISVDTSVAHLAGALGKQVWILLPFMPDFRWLLDRDDSPWYPTAKLFRQPQIGDWDSVIQQLISELNTLFSK